MRVLVAGASGTLGGPLVRRLIAAGHDVSGIVRSDQGAERVRQLGGSVILADVLDREALLAAVDGQGFDAVIHELTALRRLRCGIATWVRRTCCAPRARVTSSRRRARQAHGSS